jgi:polar amino acid transport system permease protein
MRFIIMPQAIKRVIPNMANEFISTIKYSSITSVVSIQELTFQGVQVNMVTSDFLGVWVTVSGMYLLLTGSLSVFANRLERWMARSD